MKNKKSMTQTEVKIAAAEYFLKHMLEIYHQENREQNKDADTTSDIIQKVEEYLGTIQSN